MANSGDRNEKKDFLPQDKRLRIVVQILIGAFGFYAIVSGIQQIIGAN